MNAAKGFPTTRTAVAQLQGYANPATGSIVPAIDFSTTYERDASYSLLGGRLYSRADNPGYEHVENLITELDTGPPRRSSPRGWPPPPPSSPL